MEESPIAQTGGMERGDITAQSVPSAPAAGKNSVYEAGSPASSNDPGTASQNTCIMLPLSFFLNLYKNTFSLKLLAKPPSLLQKLSLSTNNWN